MARVPRSTSIVAVFCLVAIASTLISLASSATATDTRFYFHSQVSGINNVDKFFVEGATFDTTAPTASTAVAVDLPARNGAASAIWDPAWEGSLDGTISSLTLDFWQKAPVGDLLGEVNYGTAVWVGDKEFVLPDFSRVETESPADVIHITHTYTTMLDASGSQIPLSIPASGPVTINVSGKYIDEEAAATILYDSTDYPSGFSVTTGAVSSPSPSPTTPSPSPSSSSTTAPPPGDGPTFQNFTPPSNLGQDAGEPSIGINPKTGNAMMIAGFQTLRVNDFDEATGTSHWQDVSSLITSLDTWDPILFTDQRTGRTIVSQLEFGDDCSYIAVTDDDGKDWSWNPHGCGVPAGIDHQTVGGGPFAADGPIKTGVGYKDATYYCSHVDVTAFCALSLDGGLTFGPGVPIYSLLDCAGLHGQVKVGPDGTVYVPNGSCGDQQGLAVSRDDGATWDVKLIPDSSTQGESDSAVAVGAKDTVYYGYEGGDGHAYVTISHDHGDSWTRSIDVGASLGIQNAQFPTMVAGDDDRAAFAFLGTTTPGNDQANNFPGVWHLYVATTYDGGDHWSTVDATPTDPVQKSCIYMGGFGVTTPACRNLLDFMSATIDGHGRIYVGYADGCTGTCVTGGRNTFSKVATIARQSSGKGLYAAFDGNL